MESESKRPAGEREKRAACRTREGKAGRSSWKGLRAAGQAGLPVSLLLRADRVRLLRAEVPEQVPEQAA